MQKDVLVSGGEGFKGFHGIPLLKEPLLLKVLSNRAVKIEIL